MINSILNDVKKGVGIDASYTAFDQDLIMHINTVFMILNQIGVGPKEPFVITGQNDSWEDFIDNPDRLAAVKSYMIVRVRQLFDPPINGSVTNAIKESVQELEWRLNVQVDPGDKEEESNEQIL